jgi:hypothetical protein
MEREESERRYVVTQFPFVREINGKTEIAWLKIMGNFSCKLTHTFADNSINSFYDLTYIYGSSNLIVAVTRKEGNIFFPTEVRDPVALNELISKGLSPDTLVSRLNGLHL